MAVAHDAQTRFPATDGTVGVNSSDTTTGDRTFDHAGSASAKGAVVVLICTGNTTTVTGVLYGGVTMTQVTAANDATEAGRVEVWVLADQAAFPTGTQTVTLQGCTATAKWATCSTVTCSVGSRSRVNASNFKDTTTAANPTLTVVTSATTLLYGGLHGGAASPASYVVTANYTSQFNNDWGALSSRSSRRTSEVAAGSIVYDFTFATSDDYCIAAVALEEYSPPPDEYARPIRWAPWSPWATPLQQLGDRALPAGATQAAAEAATGTGVANDPSPSIAPTAEAAAGTGTAFDATITVGTAAAAEAASATGTAFDATVIVAPGAQAASGSGTAQNPSPAIAPTPTTAEVVGAALDPATAIQTGAQVAEAIGTAYNPTVTVPAVADPYQAGPQIAAMFLQPSEASTQLAGDATTPVANVTNAPAGLATGAGTANDTTASVAPTPTTATATGTAFDATVATGSQTFANAGVAEATGTANNPGMAIAPSIDAATAIGTANAPSPSIHISAGLASGTGAANNPTITRAKFANAEAAVATAVANNPQAAIAVLAAAAEAVAEAFDADIPPQVIRGEGSLGDYATATGSGGTYGTATGTAGTYTGATGSGG